MFSEPVAGERFFGRTEVLELLNKRALALKDGYRQNVALTGQSLVGKSSIIFHFLELIREEGFVPIYVEVVHEPFRAFADKFIATMLYNALARLGDATSPVLEIDKLVARAQKSIPRTHAAVRQVNTLIERENLEEAYTGLLSLTSILKAETGLPCIVILDEFDNLEHLGVKNPFQGFGRVIMVQKDTMYIVSSSRHRAIQKIISEKLSLLFGNFEVVRIDNFDFATSCRLLEMKLPGFDIDRETRQLLYAFTDGNPFYLNTIAGRCREIAIAEMTSYLSDEVLCRAFTDTIYHANGTIHQYLMNYVLSLIDSRHRETCMAILTAIANGQNTQPKIGHALKTRKTEIAKGLEHLLEGALITKNGVFYRIEDTVLAFWFKYVYQRRKTLLIDGTIDKMALFRDEMRLFITDFRRELATPVVTRLIELLNRFANELVQIDGKHSRLPHFTKIETRQTLEGHPFITASFSRNVWAFAVAQAPVAENTIIDYIRTVKACGNKITTKVIIPLGGIEDNARLLAKELRITIWENPTLNALLELYGKRRIVPL